ncbi:MAG: DNRLRE domain-containing protein [Bacteroidetes bacterium]|nr:DNRLRE domain-containing protein [Bacteroidota bacterium]
MKFLVVTIILSGALFFSGYAQQTVTIQPGPADGIDCYINSAFPDLTGGLNEGLVACAWTFSGEFGIGRSLVKFDLTAIPAGATILNARLTLYFDASVAIGQQYGANASYLQAITADWDQMTTTWNNKPPVTTLGQVSIPATLTTTSDLADIDMTAMVQGWVNDPATNFGFMHRMQVEVTYCSEVYASSNKPVATMRPKLVVTYECDLPVALGADRTVCSGNSTTFDAGYCSGCTYLWANLTTGQPNIGTGQTYTTGIAGEYQATVVGSNGCEGSDVIQLFVDPLLPVSVTNSGSANFICSGTPVTFTAIPVNGGTTPAYQWAVNGLNVPGATNSTYSFIPSNDNTIECIMTSSEPCAIGNPATSNVITMTANTLLPVGLSVAASSNPVCSGTPVTFAATPVNGGTLPAFQWIVNGANVPGATNPTYIFIPSNGNTIECMFTSNETCAIGNPATSNTITLNVNPRLPVSISIAVSANPVCAGTSVTFTATPVNGGPAPGYQWMVGGGVNGTSSEIFNYIPVAGDLVSCVLNSALACVSNNPASSDNIMMSTYPLPDVTFGICFDNITATNAKPFKLKGGLPLGGTYSGPGVNSFTGTFDPGVAGIGMHPIRYSYINTYSCSSAATVHIENRPASSFTCGSLLTDIRDNKTYPTVQIGSQCWMQGNLGFGFSISELVPQTDNCVVENYLRNSKFVDQYSIFYQWDELMRYTPSQSSQGLCPAGWHVPTSAEWDQLLSFSDGAGLAGGTLKDMLLSNGFQSEQYGIFYLNTVWSFTTGTTAGSMYWTSTPSGTTRAVARGMNDFNLSVSRYEGARGDAFPVRCIID